MPKYEFLYRDGANYKTFFKHDTDLELNEGDEVTLEDLGIDHDDFFENTVGYPYDEEYDHNILEVVERID